MKYLILFFLSTASFACEKSAYLADLQSLKAGTIPDVIKMDCVGRSCVCVDSFPYSIDSEGLKLGTIDVSTKTLVVDKEKEAAAKAVQDAKNAQKTRAASDLVALKEKFQNGTQTAADIREALLLILKDK